MKKFERKLLSIKKFQKKENIEKIYSGDKYTIGDVIANIKSTLYKDPLVKKEYLIKILT